MAFEITVNDVDTIHDETDGLQNSTATPTPAGDANDNDIAVSELPADFAVWLTGLEADPSGAIGAALSGFDGSNDGLDVFTVTTNGSTVNNLALTDVDGNLLDGADSGLTTTAGDPIFLYTDPGNDNIVLGRKGTIDGDNETSTAADPDGDIVFAVYLDENADLTAGKLWTVQFEAIFHPDSGNDDDVSSSLTDKLYVAAARDLEFDLTNAPSGQNLFIMFGDGDISAGVDEVGIIATGKNPLDQSANPGTAISAGDTVNTSQGGGNTTFGINNQMIDEGEGIYFTFVKGPDSNYTVPNLDQNEADIEANIQFNDFLGAKGAEFQVVQLQGGKTAVVTISAYNETGSAESVDFVDGLNNDAGVAITAVQVFESDGVTPATGFQVIDNNDGTFTIKGVEAGDIIKYFTDGNHNRVLIENTGTGKGKGSADFDIGGFTLVQGEIKTEEIGSTVFWEDDGPEIDLTLGAGMLQTDDGDLAGGNSGDGTGTDTDSAGVGDLFTITESDGADGDGGTVYSLVLGANTTTSLADTATGEAVVLSDNGGVVEGRTGTSDDLVFTLSVNSATGEVTLTQSRAVVHATTDTAAPYTGDITGLGVIDAVNLSATITDGDDDTATDSIDISGTLQFTDDGPTIDLTLGAGILQTADGDLAGGNSGDGIGTDTDSAGVGDLFTVTESGGADGDDGTVYSLVLGANTTTSLVDTATDEAVVLSDNGGVVEGRTDTSDDLVFTLSVNSATGEVTLTQSRAVEHATIETQAPYNTDVTGLGVSDAVLLSATITDGDDDTATDSIDISGALQFTDDGPDVDFSNLVGTVTTTPQSGFWDGPAGADQPGTLGVTASGTFDMVTADGIASTGTVVFDNFDGTTGTGTLTADFDNDPGNGNEGVTFSLTVKEDGTYDFALDEVPLPVVTLSTDEGQLPAGGPDPAQTLTFGEGEDTTSFVFFAVDADTANSTSLGDAIGSGEPDPTEAELEALAAAPLGDGTYGFIRQEIEMNVSTSGIGVNNNVLQGEDNPGDLLGTINAFDSGAFDESFVINPEPLASSVKVFISKTAGGFLPPNEDGTLQGSAAKTDYLYVNVYDELGNSVGPILVTSDMVTDEAAPGGTGENLWSFTIDIDELALDGNSIDAIQFTMGFGNIKIPKIEVVVRGNEPPNDIFLDFEATLTDADGDSATNAFEVDLYAYDVISDTQLFDYTLADAGTGPDAFNAIDAAAQSRYLVEGFDADEDLLVLLNLADGYTLQTATDGDLDGFADDSVITSDDGQLEVVVKDATLTDADISSDTLIA